MFAAVQLSDAMLAILGIVILVFSLLFVVGLIWIGGWVDQKLRPKPPPKKLVLIVPELLPPPPKNVIVVHRTTAIRRGPAPY